MLKTTFLNKSMQVGAALCMAACFSACSKKSEYYTPASATPEAIQQLIKQSIADLVFVEGGEFLMGADRNMKDVLEPQIIEYALSERGKSQEFFMNWNYSDMPRIKTKVSNFSIMKFENSFAEYDLFTGATGRKPLWHWYLNDSEVTDERVMKSRRAARAPNISTRAGYLQAERYCAWLAEITDLPFALPTEEQYEYAARSRGREVAYATDTGYWNEGVNYPTHEEKSVSIARDTRYPPNPLGLYLMSSGYAEWTQSDWTENHEPESKANPNKNYKVIKPGGAGSPQTVLTWGRGKRPVLKSDEEIAEDKRVFGQLYRRITKEYATERIGFRCVVNLDRPVTMEDVKK